MAGIMAHMAFGMLTSVILVGYMVTLSMWVAPIDFIAGSWALQCMKMEKLNPKDF